MSDSDAAGPIRIDKWLWHARFFKSRGLAAAAVTGGPMRLNGQPVAKTSQAVRAGDVLTFVQARQVRVIRVLAPGTRRGPVSEAQALYEDLAPAPEAAAESGGERPTKRDRRAIDRLKGP